MRLFKLQVIVFAVAFLFGAIKGFSFFGGYYQTSFQLSLYAVTVSMLVALALSKTRLYPVIEPSDSKWLTATSLLGMFVWAAMLGLHLYFVRGCASTSTSCDELSLRDFAIASVAWVFLPIGYLIKSKRLAP